MTNLLPEAIVQEGQFRSKSIKTYSNEKKSLNTKEQNL